MPHPPARIRGVIGVDAAVVLLACVDLLFAAFVALQIGYLFGGRDTMDAAGLPYSAYARRGFFELIGAASLVGALLFGVGLHGRARSLLTTALGAALVGLTLAVLASAWAPARSPCSSSSCRRWRRRTASCSGPGFARRRPGSRGPQSGGRASASTELGPATRWTRSRASWV